MKEIPLSRGQVALVDDDDYHLVTGRKWQAKRRTTGDGFYAVCWNKNGAAPSRLTLHGLIMGHREGFEVDHIDCDGLNCRRANMRWATHSQNSANRKKTRANSSGYKGVSWDKDRRRWVAEIRIHQLRLFLGRFHSAEEAAIAYDDAARLHYGEFARLNSPIETERAA